jgi:hypothetical protein
VKLPYRVVDARTGKVLAKASSVTGLQPESLGEWARREEYVGGTWRPLGELRRSPDGEWL